MKFKRRTYRLGPSSVGIVLSTDYKLHQWYEFECIGECEDPKQKQVKEE